MAQRLLAVRVHTLQLLTVALLGCRTHPAGAPAPMPTQTVDAPTHPRADAPTTPSVPAPIIDSDPLVIAVDYRHWPTIDESFPRFVLFADGHVVWREHAGERWRWFVTKLDGARTAELHGAIESSTRKVAPFVPCTPSDPHNDRADLFIRVGDRMRAHRVESPQSCRAPGSAATGAPNEPPELPRGFADAVGRVLAFDPPRRTAWQLAEDKPFPGEQRLMAAFDAEFEQEQHEVETACRDSARALLACVQHVAHPDRAEQLCAEVAHHGIDDASCRMAAIFDDVCHSSYRRGCPMLVQ